ncbi:MAG: UDP-N-acetylglucosamine--N-acetylmuramyl-(pentapeptide) pyrophosphoryl-undecaprenol N-acetylglucosamine transferase [Candidatus Gottesmanbacteria bacterium]|nr:UDP-N-acetylglucosamine--N-acetylmuramyl-(pentapeptide) pyrophosphoryl-undecaprenol N-acetylglucosamine transferase [Candidatus Gottesmanbacteria bacterium]
MKQPLICVTGGHLTPALAVIEEIQRIHPDWHMFFIGRRKTFEGAEMRSEEERLVRALGIPFYGLTTGRFQRSWSPFTLLSFLKIPFGVVTAFLWLMRYRPSIILSFGGYIALPVVLAGKILNIPVITHEQTTDLGLSNRIIARMAGRVLLARDVGVPIRRALFSPLGEYHFSLLPDTEFPILYITGGSTGAQSLNALIYPLLPALSKSFYIIHQVGAKDMENALRARDGMAREDRYRYVPVSYIDVRELSWIYHNTSFLIGRSGANTTAEVAALGIPALFIPLPWAADDEQKKNAQSLGDKGMAAVLDQRTLTGEILLTQINIMMKSIHHYKKKAMEVAKHYPRDGASRVVKAIKESIAMTNNS